MRYETHRHTSYRVDDDGNMELMANFIAEIVRETHIVDGVSKQTLLTISAIAPHPDDPDGSMDPVRWPEVEVDITQYASMSWVNQWGVKAVIRPGTSMKDDLRAMIQLRSRPKQATIYRHLGWTTDGNGQPMFLHASGAITKAGNREAVEVRLPKELELYDLGDADGVDEREAFRATMELVRLTPPEIGWSLFAACLTPLFGPVDFATHVTGRTGTFKSEVMSLWQSHYGPEMDARHLPGSWSSTANALEAQAFIAKDCAFVIDDFIPSGTSWQVRAYQQTADKIIRAQGNQAGRARLTDTSNLQQTMYPRGVVLSTGEDTPEGHSVRARMLILELSPGDVEPKALTECQGKRHLYCAVVAALARQLAGEPHSLTERVEQLRADLIGIGHTRTPSMLARLIATVEYVAAWAAKEKFINATQARKVVELATLHIRAAGERQQSYLEEADPADQFIAAVRQALASGVGHFRSLAGGIPKKAAMLGWTEENADSDLPTFKARGQLLGWVSWDKGELYVDVTAGYNTLKKVAGSDITITKQTLLKRLKDAGVLTRSDEARQRNSIRVTAENHARQVIALNLALTLDTQEVPE